MTKKPISYFTFILALCMLFTLVPMTTTVSAASTGEFLFELIDRASYIKKVEGATGYIHVIRSGEVVASYEVTEYQYDSSSTRYKATIDTSVLQENDKVIFEMYCEGYDNSFMTMYDADSESDTLEDVMENIGYGGTYLGSWLSDNSYMHTAYVKEETIDCGIYDSWDKLLADLSDVMASRKKVITFLIFRKRFLRS